MVRITFRRFSFPLSALLGLALTLPGSSLFAQRVDSVVVTGVYEPAPLEEADRAVRLLDVGRNLLLSTSVADLLRLEPSLDLRQRAPGGVQNDVSIRGGTFGQTLVLLDGLRLNDVQTGHHNMDLPLPMEALSRIEVLKGSGSTLYGSDAVGGVVNLVTQAPEVSELRLRTGLGTSVSTSSASRCRWSGAAIAERLVASRDFSSGFRPNRDYRNLSFSSSSTLGTALGSTAVTLGYGDRPFGADNFYGNYPSWERTKTWFASARQQLGERTQAAFAFRRHTDLFVLYRDRPQVFTNRHAVEAFQAALPASRGPGQEHTAPLRSGRPARFHRQHQSRRAFPQRRRGVRRPGRACAGPVLFFRRPSRAGLRRAAFRFLALSRGGPLAEPPSEGESLRQPGLPRAVLHGPLLSRSRHPGFAGSAAGESPGATTAGWTGTPDRVCAAR